MYRVGGDRMEHTNTAYTNAKWLLCVWVHMCVCVHLCVFACVCVWELNHVYLPVAKAISLQVTIRLIGVVKDRTLHSKDKLTTNYFWPVACCIVENIRKKLNIPKMSY